LKNSLYCSGEESGELYIKGPCDLLWKE